MQLMELFLFKVTELEFFIIFKYFMESFADHGLDSNREVLVEEVIGFLHAVAHVFAAVTVSRELAPDPR